MDTEIKIDEAEEADDKTIAILTEYQGLKSRLTKDDKIIQTCVSIKRKYKNSLNFGNKCDKRNKTIFCITFLHSPFPNASSQQITFQITEHLYGYSDVMKTIQCAHPHHHNGFVETCRLWTASGGVSALLVLEPTECPTGNCLGT